MSGVDTKGILKRSAILFCAATNASSSLSPAGPTCKEKEGQNEKERQIECQRERQTETGRAKEAETETDSKS